MPVPIGQRRGSTASSGLAWARGSARIAPPRPHHPCAYASRHACLKLHNFECPRASSWQHAWRIDRKGRAVDAPARFSCQTWSYLRRLEPHIARDGGSESYVQRQDRAMRGHRQQEARIAPIGFIIIGVGKPGVISGGFDKLQQHRLRQDVVPAPLGLGPVVHVRKRLPRALHVDVQDASVGDAAFRLLQGGSRGQVTTVQFKPKGVCQGFLLCPGPTGTHPCVVAAAGHTGQRFQ